MLSKEHQKAFDDFVDAMQTGSGLDNETLYLVSLAAALALGCEVCIQGFLGLARAQGVDEQRLEGVAAAVMAVAAGGMRNRFLEIGD